jgi:peptide deformylase
MILPIVRYGHPVLRQKGGLVDRVTAEIRAFVSDLFDTMYEAHGVGLAAHQVGRPIQVAVLDVRDIKDRPSTLAIDGQPADVDAFMPLVLINPQVTPVAGPVEGPEGCLSFPEIYGEVERPEAVEVRATGLDGRRFEFRCGGLLAKAVQHEVDHLNGILFIDRMSRAVKEELKPELEALMTETKEALEKGAERESAAGGAGPSERAARRKHRN